MRLVSVVVPDWLMATTSVSAIDDRRPNPDSSVAGRASTRRSDSAVKRASPAASAWPATAAVPWPITRTRSMAPERRPARTSSGSVSGPRLTSSAPSRSTSLPRSVLRKLAGDSVISFSR